MRFTPPALFPALLILAAGCGAAEPSRSPQPNIIVVSIDTLRADRLPVYGYQGGRTPAIDAFAADSIVFDRAWSHSPMTLPSHASLFTGVIPPSHGVRNNVGYSLGDEPETIAGWLRERGYQAAGFVSAYVLRAATGIDRGFAHWDAEIGSAGGDELDALTRSAFDTNRAALRWLDQRDSTAPFFLFVHYYEPHHPYEAPERFRQGVATPYDAEITTADEAFGELIAALRERGLYDDSAIVLLSDHGEGLGDHGEEFHGVFVYRESIQVPLILKTAERNRSQSRRSDPVALVDVFPTLASIVGGAPPDALEGRDLTGPEDRGRMIYAESLLPQIHFGWSALKAVVQDEWHGIEAPRPELYSLSTDPQETNNVIQQNRRVWSGMRERLERIGTGEDRASSVSPEDAAKLAALGYLGSGAASASSGADPKDHIHELGQLFRAEALAAEGRLEEAAATLQKLVSDNPRLTDAWTRLGAVYQKSGDPEAAIRAWRRGVELAPSLVREHALTLADLYLQTNQLDQARAHAELALPAHPGAARLLLATIAQREGDTREAQSQAAAALADPAYRARAELLKANQLADDGKLGEALGVVEGAIARESRPVEGLHLAKGDILARLGRGEEAERAFAAELRSFPTNRMAYVRLAFLYAASGRADRAREILRIMVRADPSPDSRRLADEVLKVIGAAGQ